MKTLRTLDTLLLRRAMRGNLGKHPKEMSK